MGLSEGLAAVKAGIELAKIAREIVVKKDSINGDDLLGRISEMQVLLSDAREAISDGLEEARALKQQLDEKEDLSRISALMVFRESVYWKRVSADGEECEPEPYCPVCWEKDSKLIHLNPGATKGTWRCSVDGSGYRTAEYQTPGPIVPRYAIRGGSSWMG